jgi:hypothetical protein
MYEKGGYLTDTKETSTSYLTHVLFQHYTTTKLTSAILPTGNCYASWETKETRLQYNQSVPQLKGINNCDCGMIELLYNKEEEEDIMYCSFKCSTNITSIPFSCEI